MRLLRVLALATGFAALLSQSSAAQDARQFKDEWFWGIKGGGLLYSSASTKGTGAPAPFTRHMSSTQKPSQPLLSPYVYAAPAS